MPSSNSSFTFLKSGSEFFDFLFEQIAGAKQFIHIQLYILGNDLTGKRIIEALHQAAERGVDVFLLLDDFGTEWLGKEGEKDLRLKGLQVKRFSRRSSMKSFRFGRRLHSKIIVIDNRVGILGGLNFADRYSGYDGNEAWLDFALAFETHIVHELNRKSAVYWKRNLRAKLQSYPRYQSSSVLINHKVLFNDWLRNQAMISKAYRDTIRSAKKEVIILAAYFLPGGRMLRIIKKKAREGIPVTLILSGHSDVPFLKSATEHFYHKLLKSGVQILEWQPTNLHAKLITTDSKYLCIGSYNLNQLSDFSSLEANVWVEDEELVSSVNTRISKEVQALCREVARQDPSVLKKCMNLISFGIVRISLRVIVFFSGRKSLASKPI